MDTNVNPAVDTTDATDARYVTIARSAVSGACRSREGFGALPNNGSAFNDTYHLIYNSSLVETLPRHNHPFCDCRDAYRDPVALFEEYLARPRNLAPRAVWALFWSLAQAEHEFLADFIPYWSHEERLTGHLVSKILDRFRAFQHHWRELDGSSAVDGASQSWFHLKYMDTATSRQESVTGADLGFIVHARLHGRQEFFKAVRFQAKKVNGESVQIDLDQVKALNARDNLGYFLFYYPYRNGGFSFTPSVARARDYANLVEEAEKERNMRGKLGKTSAEPGSDRWDFASFVTFALADVTSQHGVIASDPQDAACIVMRKNGPLDHPSRLLVLTLGSPQSRPNWDSILHELGGGVVREDQ